LGIVGVVGPGGKLTPQSAFEVAALRRKTSFLRAGKQGEKTKPIPLISNRTTNVRAEFMPPGEQNHPKRPTAGLRTGLGRNGRIAKKA